MPMTVYPATNTADIRNLPWRTAVVKYQHPDLRRSLWQLANTFIPYFIVWYTMYRSLEISYWITLALSVLAAGFLVRIFAIFHDCGHGSFFKSRKANDILGFIAGVLTLTPYYAWRHEHAIHHATAGDLDRRWVGDIWTLTVNEYRELSPKDRLVYRLYRHPIILFVLGPLFLFLIWERFPSHTGSNREHNSVYWTNLALVGVLALLSVTIGIKAFVLIQLPIAVISSAAGVWMFYVQHQYEGAYWERHDNWDYTSAALQGSSFFKLPRVLQWFTANIGFHHVHHLSPRIPNYYLERCHNENPMFQDVKSITLLASITSLSFRLWDEERRQLVGFDYPKTLHDAQTS
jgi:omega-6 fatty acid desaturase (delta-12 desaturase)